MANFEIKMENGKAQVFTPYNADFVSRIKLLGGRWNPTQKCWTVNENAVDDVRSAMRNIYGQDDNPVTETVEVILNFNEEVSIWHGPVTIQRRKKVKTKGLDTAQKRCCKFCNNFTRSVSIDTQ